MKNLPIYLKETDALLRAYFAAHPAARLTPDELQEGAYVYFERGGKRLRPALARLSAGALGGEAKEAAAIPAALGLECYHTWTLIHDDVIDHDDKRRGEPSVHALTAAAFASHGEKGAEYGADTAILAGDALHSAAIFYLASLSDSGEVSPAVTLAILKALEGDFGLRLISGETEDTRNALLFSGAFWEISEKDALSVISGKTAALFGVSALTGALIGQDSPAITPEAEALRDFAESCGMAFQLQDDVLGILADEEKLGKPVLGDLREGKATPLLLAAYENADEREKEFLRAAVGKTADREKLLAAKKILVDRGGVDYAERLADSYLARAEGSLARLPASRQKDLLGEWRAAMVRRDR